MNGTGVDAGRRRRDRGQAPAGAQRRERDRRQPSLHLRRLRDRHLEPLRPRRGALGRRDAGPVVQPAVHLRRRRARQDPPPAGHRALRAARTTRASPCATSRPRRSSTSSSTPSAPTRMADFKKRYREVDVLLLDDIQFIEGKESSRRSSSTRSTPSTRPTARSCCRPTARPTPSPTLEDRLRSRFKMGLITEINPPDLETRLAILRKKAETEPDRAAARGARVHRHAHHQQHPRARRRAHPGVRLRQPHQRAARRSSWPSACWATSSATASPGPITPDLILQKTSEMFGFSVEEIRGKSRRRPARHRPPDRHVRVP